MLIVLNFVSTRVVTVVKNLVLSPTGRYHAGELSLCKVAITLPNKPLVEQDPKQDIDTASWRCKQGVLQV
jgi:hypothetical protein